jgi:hypothetical protein
VSFKLDGIGKRSRGGWYEFRKLNVGLYHCAPTPEVDQLKYTQSDRAMRKTAPLSYRTGRDDDED